MSSGPVLSECGCKLKGSHMHAHRHSIHHRTCARLDCLRLAYYLSLSCFGYRTAEDAPWRCFMKDDCFPKRSALRQRPTVVFDETISSELGRCAAVASWTSSTSTCGSCWTRSCTTTVAPSRSTSSRCLYLSARRLFPSRIILAAY
jgi:hypothetical protein